MWQTYRILPYVQDGVCSLTVENAPDVEIVKTDNIVIDRPTRAREPAIFPNGIFIQAKSILYRMQYLIWDAFPSSHTGCRIVSCTGCHDCPSNILHEIASSTSNGIPAFFIPAFLPSPKSFSPTPCRGKGQTEPARPSPSDPFSHQSPSGCPAARFQHN